MALMGNGRASHRAGGAAGTLDSLECLLWYTVASGLKLPGKFARISIGEMDPEKLMKTL